MFCLARFLPAAGVLGVAAASAFFDDFALDLEAGAGVVGGLDSCLGSLVLLLGSFPVEDRVARAIAAMNRD